MKTTGAISFSLAMLLAFASISSALPAKPGHVHTEIFNGALPPTEAEREKLEAWRKKNISQGPHSLQNREAEAEAEASSPFGHRRGGKTFRPNLNPPNPFGDNPPQSTKREAEPEPEAEASSPFGHHRAPFRPNLNQNPYGDNPPQPTKREAEPEPEAEASKPFGHRKAPFRPNLNQNPYGNNAPQPVNSLETRDAARPAPHHHTNFRPNVNLNPTINLGGQQPQQRDLENREARIPVKAPSHTHFRPNVNLSPNINIGQPQQPQQRDLETREPRIPVKVPTHVKFHPKVNLDPTINIGQQQPQSRDLHHGTHKAHIKGHTPSDFKHTPAKLPVELPVVEAAPPAVQARDAAMRIKQFPTTHHHHGHPTVNIDPTVNQGTPSQNAQPVARDLENREARVASPFGVPPATYHNHRLRPNEIIAREAEARIPGQFNDAAPTHLTHHTHKLSRPTEIIAREAEAEAKRISLTGFPQHTQHHKTHMNIPIAAAPAQTQPEVQAREAKFPSRFPSTHHHNHKNLQFTAPAPAPAQAENQKREAEPEARFGQPGGMHQDFRQPNFAVHGLNGLPVQARDAKFPSRIPNTHPTHHHKNLHLTAPAPAAPAPAQTENQKREAEPEARFGQPGGMHQDFRQPNFAVHGIKAQQATSAPPAIVGREAKVPVPFGTKTHRPHTHKAHPKLNVEAPVEAPAQQQQ